MNSLHYWWSPRYEVVLVHETPDPPTDKGYAELQESGTERRFVVKLDETHRASELAVLAWAAK